MDKKEQLKAFMNKVIEANRESKKDAEKIYFKPVRESTIQAIDKYISKCEEISMYLQVGLMVASDWNTLVSMIDEMKVFTERAVKQHESLPETIRMVSAYDLLLTNLQELNELLDYAKHEKAAADAAATAMDSRI